MSKPAKLIAPDVVKDFLRLIGQRGGERRNVTVSAARRREIARMGAAARWGKKKDKPT